MYKVGDFALYKRELCKIVEKKEMFGQEYYTLHLVKKEDLKISIPVREEKNLLDSIMTKEEIENLFLKIPSITTIETNSKTIENEYKNLLNSGKREDLVKIIKTTYLRNEKRKQEKKKISERDFYYFEKAEEYLYEEIGFVLNLTFEEVKDYLVHEIAKKEKI